MTPPVGFSNASKGYHKGRERTKNSLIVAKQGHVLHYVRYDTISHLSPAGLTVEHATDTQKVSHPPVRPKYGRFPLPCLLLRRPMVN